MQPVAASSRPAATMTVPLSAPKAYLRAPVPHELMLSVGPLLISGRFLYETKYEQDRALLSSGYIRPSSVFKGVIKGQFIC